jgi:hypothetical protein
VLSLDFCFDCDAPLGAFISEVKLSKPSLSPKSSGDGVGCLCNETDEPSDGIARCPLLDLAEVKPSRDPLGPEPGSADLDRSTILEAR